MKQFRVRALSFHSDKAQKIFNAGDIINEDVLYEDSIEKLVNEGWIEPTAKQGPLKPFSATNETPVEDPQNPLSQDQPAKVEEPVAVAETASPKSKAPAKKK